MVWMTGHGGVEGNETEDRVAKEETLRNQSR